MGGAEEPDGDLSVTKLDSSQMDTGWSWLVLFAGFTAFLMSFGMISSFGVYFVAFLDHFQCERSEAALVGSVSYGIMALCGPLSNVLYRTIGSQITVMFGGLLATIGYALSSLAGDMYQLAVWHALVGFGFGIGITSLLAIQSVYFEKYRYFATAFTTVGSALGLFIFPPLMMHTIERFTWRGSMLINACFSMQLLVCGAVMKPRKIPGNNSDKLQCSNLFQLRLFKDARFLLLCLDCLIWGGATYTYFSMTNDLMMRHGVEKHLTATIVSACGAGNVAGRIFSSIICQWKNANRPLLYTLSTMLWSSQILCSVLCRSALSFSFTSVLFGLGFGLMLTSLAPSVIELFGIEALPSAQGFMAFSVGIGGLATPLVSGRLADKYGSDMAFYFSGALGMLAVVCCSILVIIQYAHSRRKKQEDLELSEKIKQEKEFPDDD